VEQHLLTNHIIAVLVTDQGQRWLFSFVTDSGEELQDLRLLTGFAKLNTFLDDIAGKLVLRVHEELGYDDRYDLAPVLLLSVLNDMLDDIISELIDDQCRHAAVEFAEYRLSGIFFTMFQHSLYDPTSIGMGGEALDLLVEGTDDELDMLGWNSLNCFLNDVVAILILNTFQNIVLKFFHDAGLLVNQNVFQCLKDNISKALIDAKEDSYLLDHPAAVHLRRERHDMAFHLVCKDLLLGLIAMLEEFLNHVIAKNIRHQLDRVWLYLAEDLVLLVGIGSLQLLLNETRAILITTEFNDMIVDILRFVRLCEIQ